MLRETHVVSILFANELVGAEVNTRELLHGHVHDRFALVPARRGARAAGARALQPALQAPDGHAEVAAPDSKALAGGVLVQA